MTPLDHENPYKVQKKIDTCHVTPGGPWKGFSCYQIPLINLYGMYFLPLDMAHPHTGGLESNQRRVKMNNILRIISELQESNYDYLVKDVECQKYLR